MLKLKSWLKVGPEFFQGIVDDDCPRR